MFRKQFTHEQKNERVDFVGIPAVYIRLVVNHRLFIWIAYNVILTVAYITWKLLQASHLDIYCFQSEYVWVTH